MKSYLSLVPLEAKAHRRQNRMTVLCIVIAVFLVTGVFSLSNMAVKMEYDRQLKRNGCWHIRVSEIDGQPIRDEDALKLMAEGAVKAGSRYDGLNYELEKEYYVNSEPVSIVGADPEFPGIYSVSLDGAFPSGLEQIALTENASELYGLRVGDTVTLRFPDFTRDYTISGIAELTESMEHVRERDFIGAFVSIDAYQELCGLLEEDYHPSVYLQFHKSLHLKNNINTLISRYHITDVSENAAVMGMSGISSSNYIQGLYLVAAFIVLLVVLAGVLMIAGSMNTNIAQRTQFFGLLRCIGAGKDQIQHIVRREALSLCVGAVPLGVLLGILVSWGIGAVLRHGIGGEWTEFPAFMVSGIGIAAGVLIGVLTVLIASSRPAKNASKVSPVVAMSGSGTSAAPFKKAAGTGFFKVDTALGIYHARASTRNLLLMTGSFALSIVLFLSFSVILDWIGFALNTMKPYTPEISVYTADYANVITTEQAEEVRKLPEVRNAVSRMHLQTEVSGAVDKIDLISYDEQQFQWAEGDLTEGDIDRVRNECGAVMTVFDKLNPLRLGDTVELNGQTLEIAAILSDSPFSTNEVPILLCSEDSFTALTGIDRYAVLDIQTVRNSGDEIIAKIRTLFGNSFRISDSRETIEGANNTYYAFVSVAYCFLGMIALISVFNIINSISMSVSARIRQYGVMRAVGMEERQLIKVIAGEALFYCLCGIIAGCTIGLPTHALLYSRIITHYFGKAWRVPTPYLLVILFIVALAGVLSVCAPAKHIRQMTVTETIRSL